MAVAVAQENSLLSSSTRAKGVLLIGPSGVGKSTLMELVISRHHDARGLRSTTSRPPRNGESDSGEYEFLELNEHDPQDAFEYLESMGEFVWTLRLVGYCYGTRKSVFTAALNSHNQVFVAHVHVTALESKFIREGGYLESGQILPISILPPGQDVIRKRILDSGYHSDEEVEARLARDLQVSQEISEVRKKLIGRGVQFPEISNSGSLEDLYYQFLNVL